MFDRNCRLQKGYASALKVVSSIREPRYAPSFVFGPVTVWAHVMRTVGNHVVQTSTEVACPVTLQETETTTGE